MDISTNNYPTSKSLELLMSMHKADRSLQMKGLQMSDACNPCDVYRHISGLIQMGLVSEAEIKGDDRKKWKWFVKRELNADLRFVREYNNFSHSQRNRIINTIDSTKESLLKRRNINYYSLTSLGRDLCEILYQTQKNLKNYEHHNVN